MTFTPSDLRAAADREDDPALAAMLRQGAEAMERVRELARVVGIVAEEATSAEIPGGFLPSESPDWHRGYDAAISKCRAAEARLAALTEKQE